MRSHTQSDDDRGPYLGGLLRLARISVVARIARKFAEAGITDWHQAHYPILQMLHQCPAGVRLTALAAGASMTKQSMGELVDGLAALGYVERVADPHDGRARLVRFTARGNEISHQTRAAVLAMEQDLAAQMSEDHVEALKALLREVVALG